jgi:hypothetical protein
MADRHLITSALPYVSGVKHLGNLAGQSASGRCACPIPASSTASLPT